MNFKIIPHIKESLQLIKPQKFSDYFLILIMSLLLVVFLQFNFLGFPFFCGALAYFYEKSENKNPSYQVWFEGIPKYFVGSLKIFLISFLTLTLVGGVGLGLFFILTLIITTIANVPLYAWDPYWPIVAIPMGLYGLFALYRMIPFVYLLLPSVAFNSKQTIKELIQNNRKLAQKKPFFIIKVFLSTFIIPYGAILISFTPVILIKIYPIAMGI